MQSDVVSLLTVWTWQQGLSLRVIPNMWVVGSWPSSLVFIYLCWVVGNLWLYKLMNQEFQWFDPFYFNPIPPNTVCVTSHPHCMEPNMWFHPVLDHGLQGCLKGIGLSNCGTLAPVSHSPHVFGVIVLGCFRFVCQTHKFLLSFVLADFPIFTPYMVLSPWLLCVSKQCHLLSLLWKMNPVEKDCLGTSWKRQPHTVHAPELWGAEPFFLQVSLSIKEVDKSAVIKVSDTGQRNGWGWIWDVWSNLGGVSWGIVDCFLNVLLYKHWLMLGVSTQNGALNNFSFGMVPLLSHVG